MKPPRQRPPLNLTEPEPEAPGETAPETGAEASPSGPPEDSPDADRR